jgi:hypothetical protein
MTIHIQEQFWSAWQKYGWAKGVWGIGLDSANVEQAIKNKESLEIKIGKGKDIYLVSPVTVKNYAEKNGTTHKAKGTILYVVPQTELKRKIVF